MKSVLDYLKKIQEDGGAAGGGGDGGAGDTDDEVSTNNVGSGNVAMVTPPMGQVQKRKKPLGEEVSNSTETDNALADTVGQIPLGTVYADGAKGKVNPNTGEEINVADEFECTVSRFLRLQAAQSDVSL